LHRNELAKLSNITSEIFGITLPIAESPEVKIDRLMQEYVTKLKELKSIKDNQQAILTMQAARTSFMNRAKEIQPEIKQWLSSLPIKEAATCKENLLLKPYFKNINDLVSAFQLSDKLDNNEEMKHSLEAMDDFLTVLYE
jgi:hypothetical protein